MIEYEQQSHRRTSETHIVHYMPRVLEVYGVDNFIEPIGLVAIEVLGLTAMTRVCYIWGSMRAFG